MRGQEELIGVVYVDNMSEGNGGLPTTSRLTDEHLKAVLAVARQTALAVESRRFHDAFLKAERFAAMGQTVAVLSHHIKNILQGVKMADASRILYHREGPVCCAGSPRVSAPSPSISVPHDDT